MIYRRANLDRFRMTSRVRRIAKTYTCLRHYRAIDGGRWIPTLKIGNQYFDLREATTMREASWVCWMAAKALANLLTMESKR